LPVRRKKKEMNLEITCPVCNFSKTVPEDKIPGGVRWVICPGCKHRFEFAPIKPEIVESTAESGEGSPWERRLELGLWQGIYQTFVSVLFSPARFFREMSSGKGIKEPMAFGLLLGSLGYMLSFFWEFLLVSGAIKSLSSDIFSQVPLNQLFMIAMFLSPILAILNMFITAAVIHVSMLAFNSGKGRFEGTFRVIAFGQATKVLSIVPFLGVITGWVWNIAVVVNGLKEIHKTSNFKAIAAVFVSIILSCLVLAPLFLLITLLESFGVLH
jgi:hypothetical protein